MTNEEMLANVQSQLALDLNCSVDDLNSGRDSLVFVEAKENPGCRPFPRKERYFEILSMGQSIIVSATPERLQIARIMMQGNSRDAIFSLPFIRGLYLHFLPDIIRMQPVTPPGSFTFELIRREEVVRLFDAARFNEAVIYDPELPWQTDLAMLAMQDGEIAGVAGASQTCAKLWQIGIEVLPQYRNMGLAGYLVNRLTYEILECGGIPSYDVIASNIASQRVAHRLGYFPAWVSDWRCNFEGLE
ncbi:GNAT family N-acetyltransferase [Paenibacillus sp. MMS20-IR301]|uniref:GNAT family N-acetyltransferase n=1 Tax=Paenibacillus sp. MMS20-IR301 TaxID=2895946 RepID=UPI0028E268E9|nr:GNAT family N-acetyltransferase [Paenibacillus sp. MMS20-IR301]WNS46826.1 GNAT family N-acetyltransferase [Paenibacillus sp. MMS20-IR301]